MVKLEGYLSGKGEIKVRAKIKEEKRLTKMVGALC